MSPAVLQLLELLEPMLAPKSWTTDRLITIAMLARELVAALRADRGPG